MTKCRRLRNGGRRKAIFGSEEAATLAAAAITAAATYGAAKIGANATIDSARQQADATIKNAKQQSSAIKSQNENANRLQEKSIEEQKRLHEDEMDRFQTAQQNLLLQMGAENESNINKMNKIQFKAGGIINKRSTQSLLRGGFNRGFQITDGGGALYRGRTPEGFDMYELYGNDHEHYHKTKNGKYKTGVGVKTPSGEVIEGEGNQNSGTGEFVVSTPNELLFLSRHSIKGFNPAKNVKRGMNPILAYNIQENVKKANGIKDDGGKKLYGGIGSNFNMPLDNNIMLFNSINDAALVNKHRKLRNGGRIKADNGTYWDDELQMYVSTSKPNNTSTSTTTGTTIKTQSSKPSFGARLSNALSSPIGMAGLTTGITAGANLLGAAVSASANRKAAGIIADADSERARIMGEAYRSLRGIDPSLLRREDYRAAHVMPAIRTATINVNPELESINRDTRKLERSVYNTTLSGAARHNRLMSILSNAQNARSRVYAAQRNAEEQISQSNAQALTKASETNAYLDTQAMREYNQAKREFDIYNNNIRNEAILGEAGVKSDAITNTAQAYSNAATSSANAWAGAIGGIGLTASNTLSAMAKRKADIDATMLGAGTEAQVRYLGLNGSQEEKNKYIAKFQEAINSGKLSAEDEAMYRRYIQWLS